MNRNRSVLVVNQVHLHVVVDFRVLVKVDDVDLKLTVKVRLHPSDHVLLLIVAHEFLYIRTFFLSVN